MKVETVTIGARTVGAGHPTFIVAELSGNHNGSIARAHELIDAAHAAGADAVKLQTYTPDTITMKSDAPAFRAGAGLWEGRTLHDLYGEAMTPWEWHAELIAHAHKLGMECFSSPFDATAVDFLEKLAVPAYKIASFEIVDIPLIERAARTGKPLIMSTGMASLQEIGDAVAAAERAGARELALLKCTSAYPAPPSSMNLATIPHLRATFGVPVGLSDHTTSSAAAVSAVALGACLVEKHLTLRRADGGPDAGFSLEPAELTALVEAIRTAEAALGAVVYGPTAGEEDSLRFRRSLFVVKDVKSGEPFTDDNVRSIRPADGLAPKHWAEVRGRVARHDVAAGTPVTWDLLR